MANRIHLYKVVAVILVFLIFLQYLYLYPVKLNFNYAKPPSLAADVSLENSLFYIKTSSSNSKRSTQHDPLSSSSASDHLDDEVRGSAKYTTILNHHKNETTLSSSTTAKEDNGSKTFNNGPVKLKTNTEVPVNQTNEKELPLCPTRPPTLLGNVRVILKEPPTLAGIGRIHNDLALGGRFKPPSCRSKDRVAIIVPFRDREEHLRTFLFNILPFLKRQQIEFNIFVIEQGSASKEEPFNRAM